MDALQELKDFLHYYKNLFTLTEIHAGAGRVYNFNEFQFTVVERNNAPYRTQDILGLTITVLDTDTMEFAFVRVTGIYDTTTNITSWNEPYLID